MIGIAAALFTLTLQQVVAPPPAPRPDSANHRQPPARTAPAAALADAYLDPAARELVELARGRREESYRSLARYRTVVNEDIWAKLRLPGRDRLLFRRQDVARVDWPRGGTARVEVIGARELEPAETGAGAMHVPHGLRSDAAAHAFDPADDRIFLGFSDSSFIRHPLAAGAEADYRYRSGGTTVIRLQDGRRVRLRELVVLPRRPSFQLVEGSLWVDSATNALVQALLRPSAPFDIDRSEEVDPGDAKVIPGILKPLRLEIGYLVVEYSLHEMRWWLPRLLAMDGHFRMGPLVNIPFHMERTYADYAVEGDTAAPVASPAAADLAAAAGAGEANRCDPETEASCICARGTCRLVHVVLPADTVALLEDSVFPAALHAEGSALIDAADWKVLVAGLEALPRTAPVASPPRFAWGLQAPGLVRYNRVEGFSLGARLDWEAGPVALDAVMRIGHADPVPVAEFGVTREGGRTRLRAAGYRRLAASGPGGDPLGAGNSLAALLFGRDDGDYYRTLGVELTGEPAGTGRAWYEWRVFAERQRNAGVETQFSVRRLLDRDHRFRPNPAADPADQAGLALALHAARGLDPAGFRWNAHLAAEAATGTFDYAKPAATLGITFPLPGPVVGSIEGAAGTAAGPLPAQARWSLGGPGTLRGYPGGILRGESFWRARTELAGERAAARLVLFADAGWAGEPARFGSGKPLVAAGAGLSIFDGLIRFDVARALRSPTGWRLDIYVDGAL